MEMLLTKIKERAAQIVFQSYNTITEEDAFYMAIGEAEVEFDCDLDFTYKEVQAPATIAEFNSKEELVSARTSILCNDDLNEGGVFDANGNAVTDEKFNRECAEEEVTYISGAMAQNLKLGFNVNAWYIKGFGYCRA